MLFHGVHKMLDGVDGVAGMLASRSLPQFLAYGTYLGEVVAPILILLGVYTRPAALVLSFTMVMAVVVTHPQGLWQLGAHGAWAVELPVFYLLGGLAIALLGAGRIALYRSTGCFD